MAEWETTKLLERKLKWKIRNARNLVNQPEERAHIPGLDLDSGVLTLVLTEVAKCVLLNIITKHTSNLSSFEMIDFAKRCFSFDPRSIKFAIYSPLFNVCWYVRSWIRLI